MTAIRQQNKQRAVTLEERWYTHSRKRLSVVRDLKTDVVALSKANDEAEVPYRNEPLVLSERDSKSFLEIMENPPQPSKALISLFS